MRLRSVLTKIIEYGFYLLFFAVPLVYNPSRSLPSFELFEWNKMVTVYVLTTIIVTSWIALSVVQKKIRFTRTPFDIPLLLFFGSAALSTLFSIDTHVSIFGYYSRFHGGLLSTICYLLLFYAFVSNREYIKLKLLFIYALSSGIVVALYGIAQKFGVDHTMWVQDVRSRVFSTLGQPNWLAALLVILLPILIGLILIRSKNQNVTGISKLKPFVLVLLAPLFYMCLLFTKSRSGFIAFWAAYVFFWCVLYMFDRSRRKIYLPLLTLLTTTCVILNFFIKTPLPAYNRLASVEVFSSEPAKPETPPVGDSVINVGITDSADIRKIVWQGAIDIARDFPLFGTGPETFAYAYYKYRPAAHNLTSEWDFLYNRAHNEFLNVAATQGFLGLGLYLLLIGTVYIWILKQLRGQTKETQVLLLALLAAYTSIHITNFFGFSVVVVGLYFFLIPAFAFTLVKPVPRTDTSEHNLTLGHGIVIGAVCLGGLFFLGNSARFWVADSLYAQALKYSRQSAYNEAQPLIIAATELRSDEPVYHDERAWVTSNLAVQAFESEDATRTAELMREAIDESTTALRTSPQNVNFWKSRTRLFFTFSTIDPSFMEQAVSAIQIASELAPTDAKVAYNKAVALGRIDRNAEAIEVLKKSIELKPDYKDSYVALAIFYEEEKQYDLARQTLEEALAKVDPNDEELKQRLEQLP